MSNYEPQTLTIPANEIKAGDYLSSSYQNGRGGYASIGIGSINHRENTVVLYGATTSYEYPNTEMLTIERWS